jgi:hypothetical protein
MKSLNNKPLHDIMKTIKHGIDDINCYCRQCDWSCFDKNGPSKAKYHCQKTKHTVDIYRENRTELTFNWRSKNDNQTKQ